jgi:hypothetical protein
MSLRLGMLQSARLAPRLLNNSSDLVRRFLYGQLQVQGGFQNRAGATDLYYTVFGLDSMIALDAAWPMETMENYLRGFGSGEGLDLVHLACLARGWAALRPGPQLTAPDTLSSRCAGPGLAWRQQMTGLIEAYRARDGGFSLTDRERGSAYGAFLVLGAYQDLEWDLPDPTRLIESVKSLHTLDGGWANERSLPFSTALATASALMVMAQFNLPLPEADVDWLMRCWYPQGGFRAAPSAPLPDLLSTAVVLHALATAGRELGSIREPCLAFLDSLWTNVGSFHGHWAEDQLDCEYTFYGLLALGHLVV